MSHDPTHGRIDRDIQQTVDEMNPPTLGSRVAMENTLQERRNARVQSRPAGAWETTRKRGLYRRLTLRRADGRVYLNRWGFGHDRIGGVLLHRMDAPDPGVDLHDHPWWFASIILWGGYTEQRTDTRDAPMLARIAEAHPTCTRGVVGRRRWLSVKTMRLDECHTITDLTRRTSWSLIIKGPRRRKWGFYLPDGYMPERQYDATVRAERRDMWAEVSRG